MPPLEEKTLEEEVFDVLSIHDSGEPEPDPEPTPVEPPAGEGVATPSSSPEPAAPEPAPAPSPAAPEPASPAASSAPAEPSPEPAPQAAAPAVDEGKLRQASLEAQIDALTRTIEELRANPQPAASATPATTETGQPQDEGLVRYGLTLPKPVVDALQSDDPEQNVRAINQIANDMGTIIHNSVIKQVRAEVGAMFQAMMAEATQETTSSSREEAVANSRKKYYDAFPAHDNELILPIIQVESRKMAAEFPGLSFDDSYIAALGTRVNNALAKLRGEQPSANPAPAPAQRPAAMMPSGNRGAAPAPTSEQGQTELIEDTFSMFGGE